MVEVTASAPSPEVSLATEAARVAEMIEKLPTICHTAGNVPLLQQAGVECFFVHVRSIIEFLGIRPAKSGDRSAVDLLGAWSPPTDNGPRAAQWQTLNDHWLTASKHVMHFSEVRTKQENGTYISVRVELPDLEAIADDVLTLWDEFSDQVAAADLMVKWAIPKRGGFRLWNQEGTAQHH
jgi:hypothetical protein